MELLNTLVIVILAGFGEEVRNQKHHTNGASLLHTSLLLPYFNHFTSTGQADPVGTRIRHYNTILRNCF